MSGASRDSSNAAQRRKAWLAATCRRNEIIRLGLHRVAQGGRIDDSRFLFVLAHTLGSAERGPYRVKMRIVHWQGLNSVTLAIDAKRAGIPRLGGDDPLVQRAMGKVDCSKPMGADAAGRLLSLTAEERDLLAIRTMEAVDEAREEREARRREERRAKDAERKRRARAELHTPREASLSAQKPWVAMGVCRRTYERRKLAMSQICPQQHAVATLSVSQICPRTHTRSVSRGSADKFATPVLEAAEAPRLQRSGSSICITDGAGGAARHEGLIGGEVEAPSEPILPSPSHLPVSGETAVDQLHRDVELMLGSGDLKLGRELAAALGRSQVLALRSLLPEVGGPAWADAIARAAARARRLLKSKSNEGEHHVLA